MDNWAERMGAAGEGRPVEQGQLGNTLQDGSRIAVIGAGPAGSMFSYFVLTMAENVGLDVDLDIYEPRSFEPLRPCRL